MDRATNASPSCRTSQVSKVSEPNFALRSVIVLQTRPRRRMPLVMPTTVHIRRSYAECRYGQLHLTTAYPSGGGFDEKVPLVCLHPAGNSSQYFAALLPELGRDRSIYAFDLPGYGCSDAPGGDWSAADLGAAIGEFVDSLRLRSVDVLGAQLGALTAIEMAAARPQQIRRLVLASVPHFSPQEAKAPEWNNLPALPAADGSHLLKDWQQLQRSRGVSATPEQLTEELADVLRSRRRSAQAMHVMLEYPTAKRLAALRQSGLILRAHDEFYEHGLRAKSSLAQSLLEDLPESGSNLFGNQPQRVLQLVRQYLDR
jgi:pimeloyl-ACP methyl ester carboxylesterase